MKTRNEYIAICDGCENKAFDPTKGIICGITNAEASFEDECESYKKDPTVKQVVEYQEEIAEEDNAAAVKNMLYGGLWCVGGTIATLAEIGYIFWGAIVFGGLQFLGGLMSYLSQAGQKNE